MDVEKKRVAGNSSRTGVVVGSIWESRMKGSFKVFNGDEKNEESERPIDKNNPTEPSGETEKVVLRSKQSSNGISGGGKRKTWKSDGNSEGNERIPIQIPKARSESKKVLGELSKELSVSMEGNGIKKSPIQIKKGRQEWNKEQSVSIDGIERRTVKTRSLSRKVITSSELSDGIEEDKSLSTQGAEDIEVKTNESKKNRSDSSKNLEESDDVCEEKLMTDDLGKVKTLDTQEACNEATMEESEEINEERAIVVVKEMEPISTINKKKSPDIVVTERKKIQNRSERSSPISRTISKQPPPVVNHPRISSKPNEFPSARVPKSHNKLHNIIDLIMWRDASKSALIFGLGTFSILSSSYAKDLNISLISVISYLGLIYLAAIFIFRSFIIRSVVGTDDVTDEEEEYVVGEEEAIWALKLLLPYINEFLLKVKALFSGDPATTMKLAVLLFVLARCGSSITIWKMAKLGFFAVFTVPKICSSYSSQLTEYGTFWAQRFKDAWESCTQKKAVAFGVFTIVWNLSSTVARIWAVFMLLVAFKYYQQSMMKDEEVEEEEPITGGTQSSWQEQRSRITPVATASMKLKKRT